MKFDESNGSQREQVSENLVDDEEPPSVSIFRMRTGEVMPREVQVQTPVDTSNQDPPSSTRVEPPSSQAHQEESQVHGDDHGQGFDQGGEQGVKCDNPIRANSVLSPKPLLLVIKR
jgi:hypothetical protein